MRVLYVLIITCFDGSHPSGYEVISYCDFDWHFLNTNDTSFFFICIWPFIYLLKLNVYINFLPVFKLGCLTIVEKSYKISFYILGIWLLSSMWFTNIFFCGLFCFVLIFVRVLLRQNEHICQWATSQMPQRIFCFFNSLINFFLSFFFF